MKKIFALVVIFSNIFYICHAQEGQEDGEMQKKIEAIKIAFITKHLDLSPEEAQKFWPVFNKFSHEIKEARKLHKDDVLKRDEAVLNIKKKFKPDFVSAIGDVKFNKFLNAEGEFKKFLQRKLKERREQNADGPPRFKRKNFNEN